MVYLCHKTDSLVKITGYLVKKKLYPLNKITTLANKQGYLCGKIARTVN